MQSYFFIPASRLHKLSDIKKSYVDEIIIDFEDAILSSNIDTYFNQLNTVTNLSSYWFRVPLRAGFEDELNLTYIERFKNIGVQLMVLPKIKSAAELITIISTFKTLKFIILIEHPRLLLEIQQVFMNEEALLKSIIGIGMGSHDLMTFLKAKHTLAQLDYPRKTLLYLAKAYHLQAIDIASMNVFNENEFTEEIKYAQDNGYDGKFLIHPTQLDWFKNQTQQDNILLDWAKNVLQHLPKNYNGESVVPFILNEEVIEKPHALKALEIIRTHNNGK